MSYAGDCTRVYSRTGAKAHLLRPTDSPNSGYATVLCGMSPQWFESWYGTGTQAEHERAAELPVCARCEQKAAAVTGRDADALIDVLLVAIVLVSVAAMCVLTVIA